MDDAIELDDKTRQGLAVSVLSAMSVARWARLGERTTANLEWVMQRVEDPYLWATSAYRSRP